MKLPSFNILPLVRKATRLQVMLKVTQPIFNSDAVLLTSIKQADCAEQTYINPINFKYAADMRGAFNRNMRSTIAGFFVAIIDYILVNYIDKHYASGQEIRTKLKRYTALAG
jgi:hypothetical protein